MKILTKILAMLAISFFGVVYSAPSITGSGVAMESHTTNEYTFDFNSGGNSVVSFDQKFDFTTLPSDAVISKVSVSNSAIYSCSENAKIITCAASSTALSKAIYNEKKFLTVKITTGNTVGRFNVTLDSSYQSYQQTATGSELTPGVSVFKQVNVGSGRSNSIFSAISGTWYDPAYDGSGFNVAEFSNGLFVYFYGYKSSGDGVAQWLITESGIPTPIEKGKPYSVKLVSGFVGNGASFTTKPTSKSSGTEAWGEMTLTFNSCATGIAVLKKRDGQLTITHNIIRLASLSGLTCIEKINDKK